MSYRVQKILAGPRVEGRDVKVFDGFVFCACAMIQFDGIGEPTVKGISGLEPGHEFEGIDQGTDH